MIRSCDPDERAADMAATRTARGYRPSCRWRRQRGPWRRSSRQHVAVQGVEGAAALLGALRFRGRHRAERLGKAGRGGRLLLLHLLRHAANLLLQRFGVLVAGLELVADLRRDSALLRIGLDIIDHLDFGRAETGDQLAGLLRRRLAVGCRLDHLAALLGILAQRYEALHAGLRRTRRRP